MKRYFLLLLFSFFFVFISCSKREEAISGNIPAAQTETINKDKPLADLPNNADPVQVAEDKLTDKDTYVQDEDAYFEYKYLAVNPEDCIVTHCYKYEGFEYNALECNTKNILDAGFYLGETTYRIGKIIRSGRDCTYQGEEWRCFIDKDQYSDYIKSNNLRCVYDEKKECLVETNECEPE